MQIAERILGRNEYLGGCKTGTGKNGSRSSELRELPRSRQAAAPSLNRLASPPLSFVPCLPHKRPIERDRVYDPRFTALPGRMGLPCFLHIRVRLHSFTLVAQSKCLRVGPLLPKKNKNKIQMFICNSIRYGSRSF